MADIRYPGFIGDRGVGYWLRPVNLAATRQGFMRLDYSNEWRYAFGDADPPDRVVSLRNLLPPGKDPADGFKLIILGDTGEGDRSQYGFLPLLRALKPDFMIINGDVAYPAGRTGGQPGDDDFLKGFFQPYRNFQCAIWATPGNHEYYSTNDGRDFYDIFCTRKFDARWSEYGLRHDTLQPGMYWELSDPDGVSNLVLIGLDSGMTANLDGHNCWWQFWKRHIDPDAAQHVWLDARLRRAQIMDRDVIIMFHIPALVKERAKEEYLSTIHSILAGYPCVRLVLCGHEHNFQGYTRETFRLYIEREILHRQASHPKLPTYLVCGSGGAYLQSNGYSPGPYQALRFPSKDQWDEYERFGRAVVSGLGLDKALVGRIAGFIDRDSLADADVARYLSCILIEVKRGDGKRTPSIRPVFLDDLKALFKNLPPEQIVDVTSADQKVDPALVGVCLQPPIPMD